MSVSVSSPSPSLILRPPVLGLGVERYVAEGGGSVIIEVSTGDTITVVDIEGGQPCELISVPRGDNGKQPNSPDGVLGVPPDSDATGFFAILEGDDSSARRARRSLERRGISIDRFRALRLFGATSPSGTKTDFVIERDGYIILAVPPVVMDMEAQNTVTSIELFVRRSVIPTSPSDIPLPEPLADPTQDIRISASTARSFVVSAGEYIQIIDVSGRQCSDFQAFARRKLDSGKRLALDATITRSLLGLTNPKPGLPSKAFDIEMDPLVEVIQDTCGRHDVFMTACNSRYYADMGYPGHVNCTDNFNGALLPYEIEGRRGWEALNYFYNTNIDSLNQIYFDEPWSRAGDYVLMRALTDLVCVASACPCDIDAANGWDPTDIHVRVYGSDETFERAVAFRMTPESEAVLTKQTGFHDSFGVHTRDFVEYGGYWLPSVFRDGVIDEYWSCRESAVVMDLSPLRKYEITGPDAERLMNYCVTRDVSVLSDGGVVYTAMCYEHGGMVDDGTVYRLGPQNFRWVGGSDVSGLWLREQAEKLGLEVWVRSSTDQLHNLAVQGPKSRDILKDIIWTPPSRPELTELEWFRFTVGRIGDFQGIPVVVSRTGYTGELGYEIFCHPKDCSAVFDAVWAAGEPHGLRPFGLDALDMVRIESGLIFAGYEFDDTTDPFEAGIGFTVPIKSKNVEFVGREALADRKAHPHKKLVGLDVMGDELVGQGDTVHIGRAQVGEITSGMRSPLLKKSIALARLDVAHSEVGTEVEVGKLDGHTKRLPAKVVLFPHYDPKKERPRS